MKIRCAVAALALGLALAAAPAQASHRTIVFQVRLDPERPASCAAGDLFGLAFDMISPAGRSLGTGQSCVHSTDDGCVPFTPFCRSISDATFTLDLRRGSLTARMRLREVQPTESSVIQRGDGRITSATGAFAGSSGRVRGGGEIVFTEDGPVTALVYSVSLTAMRVTDGRTS